MRLGRNDSALDYAALAAAREIALFSAIGIVRCRSEGQVDWSSFRMRARLRTRDWIRWIILTATAKPILHNHHLAAAELWQFTAAI